MTDTPNINRAVGELISHLQDGRFANAGRHASDLRTNVDAWADWLCKVRNDACRERDSFFSEQPASSRADQPNDWRRWEHRFNDARARHESVGELQAALLRLSDALRRVSEESNKRSCDREYFIDY